MSGHAILLAAVLWLVGAGIPLAAYLTSRRRPQVGTDLPVCVLLVDASGIVIGATGGMGVGSEADEAPAAGVGLIPAAQIPRPGQRATLNSLAGQPLAVLGIDKGDVRATAVVLPREPFAARRIALASDLVRRFAHDAATPLTALTGQLDILERVDDPEQRRQALAVCHSQIQRLADMARQASELSPIRPTSVGRRIVSAGALVEEAAVAVLDLADDSKVSLAVMTPEQPVMVDVVDGDILRVLRNLAVNAIRHGSAAGDTVQLAVERTSDDVTFTVTDAGSGFDPAASRGGLGLVVCRELLASHDTTLAVTHSDTGLFSVGFTVPAAT